MLKTAAKGQAVALNIYQSGLRRLRPAFAAVGLFSAVINILMLTGSIYMLQVYDRVLSSGSVPTLFGLFAIVVVLYAFLGYYDFLRTRSLSRMAIKLDQMAGAATFRSWVRSGLPGDTGAGPTAGQPLRDLEVVRSFLSGPAVMALFDLPWVPLYLGILFFIHAWLGWLTVAGAGVVFLLALTNRTVTRRAILRSMAMDGAERDFTERSRRGAEAIQAMGMERAITARWRALHEATLAAGQMGSDPSEMLAAASRAFRMLLQSAILTVGALLVLRGEISGGMIIASSILTGRALTPVDQIIGQWRTMARALEAHRNLGAFFAGQPAEKQQIDLPTPTGQITVTRVSKLAPGKPGTERARILNQVSFTLEPGDGLGVIGNSASGKSTLARLLVGAWGPDAGEIRLDGATLDQWDPVKLGRAIGYLPQTLEMLPGTIRDNIARFDPEADDGSVIAAAKLAGVHEMILRLPEGYATRLGGSEMPLSGGQIQRLGLARAIYGQPRLVVLDEPNSNLDVAGDDALAQTIAALRAAGSAVIVMAHRPSAIAAVNKVMILHNGTVAQFGDKDEILAAATGRASPTQAPQAAIVPEAVEAAAMTPEGGEKPEPTGPDVPRNVAARVKAMATGKTSGGVQNLAVTAVRPGVFRPVQSSVAKVQQ